MLLGQAIGELAEHIGAAGFVQAHPLIMHRKHLFICVLFYIIYNIY